MVARTVLISILLAAAARAQQSPVHMADVTFSVTGTYTLNGQSGANLSGSGQFSFLGSVQLNGTIQVVATGENHNACSVYLSFQATQPDGTVAPGANYVAGIGLDQICYTDNPLDGFPSASVVLFGGTISAGGSETTKVKGGYLTFVLKGEDFNFTITGQGQLNLAPAQAQTASTGGSSYPPVVAGPGGSGYPAVVNGANAGSVLVFNDAANSTTASARPYAAANSSSIQIPLPVQSVASTYNVTVDCPNSAGDCWIGFPSAGGAISANSSTILSASVNTQGLSPGVYPATVAITITPGSAGSGGNPAPTTLTLPLTAIVATDADVLGLSQTGLQFQAVAGSPAQSESISISSLSGGSLPFTAAASTPSGQNWLLVTPEGGTATGSTAAKANVEANPAGLAPGTYFGSVDFLAAGAVNSPQSVNVALTVLPASNSATPVLSPVALNFVANGSSNPAPQPIQLSAFSDQPVSIATQAITNDGANWLVVSPSSGTAASGQPLAASVSVQPANLSPGIYNGTVVLEDTNNNNNIYPVSVQLVVPKPAPCTPSQLLPVVTNLNVSSSVTAALPFPIAAQIVDDCGSPLTTGSVALSFSSGDPAVTMSSNGNGQWQGTWMPHTAAGGGVTVTVSASSGSLSSPLNGSSSVAAIVAANLTAPIVSPGGVVSAAAPTPQTPIAPGGFVSIFGSNLATADTPAPSLPLPTLLSDTQVFLGGHLMPLAFAGPGQINAVVPYGVAANTIQQLTVVHNGIPSLAETLVVASAQPAVFTQLQSGTGPGVIIVVKPDGTQFLNTASTPAAAGDALEIYCAGLGAVAPQVPDGSAAPSSPLARTTLPVAVTIGGQNAPVAFSGLAPGFAGLYQVNVTVPNGIPPAADVPLVISAGNSSSPTVTLALQ